MEKKATYEAYTKELKNRFKYIVISFFCAFIICYYKATQLTYLFVTSCYTKNSLDLKISFIFTDVREAFSATLLICFFFSLLSFSLFVWYSLVCFFLPGWFVYERSGKLLGIAVPFFLCIVYILWVHIFILPKVCDFFFAFQVQNVDCFSLIVEPRIYSYVSWGVWFLVLASLFFAFVCSLLLLIVRGKLPPSRWNNNRKSRVFGTVLLAALASPPELFTQSLISLALFFFLELIVFFAFLFYSFAHKKSTKVFLL